MSLQQDFKTNAEILVGADFQEVTPRLIGLLEWMKSQSEIKTVLDDLRKTPGIQAILDAAGHHNPPKARTQREIAAVGLAIVENCVEGKTELFQLALGLGISPSYSTSSLAAYSKEAMTRYIVPFLNFVLRQLPTEVALSTALPTPSRESYMDIFISHNSADRIIAEALVDLLQNALNIPANRIRCTSVDGTRLPLGAETDSTVRREIRESKVFIGLITPNSIRSIFVLLEIGARWGQEKYLASLLAAGADPTLLKGPLGNLNALDISQAAQVHQLIENIARELSREVASAASYNRYLSKLVEVSSGV